MQHKRNEAQKLERACSILLTRWAHQECPKGEKKEAAKGPKGPTGVLVTLSRNLEGFQGVL